MNLSNRILCVSDDPRTFERLSSLLEQNNCCVTSTNDGKSAIEAMIRTRFDLYLIDCCLSDITAVDLSKYMRDIGVRAPIIVYASPEHSANRTQWLEAGATNCVGETDDPEVATRRILQYLSKPAPSERKMTQSPPTPSDAFPN